MWGSLGIQRCWRLRSTNSLNARTWLWWREWERRRREPGMPILSSTRATASCPFRASILPTLRTKLSGEALDARRMVRPTRRRSASRRPAAGAASRSSSRDSCSPWPHRSQASQTLRISPWRCDTPCSSCLYRLPPQPGVAPRQVEVPEALEAFLIGHGGGEPAEACPLRGREAVHPSSPVVDRGDHRPCGRSGASGAAGRPSRPTSRDWRDARCRTSPSSSSSDGWNTASSTVPLDRARVLPDLPGGAADDPRVFGAGEEDDAEAIRDRRRLGAVARLSALREAGSHSCLVYVPLRPAGAGTRTQSTSPRGLAGNGPTLEMGPVSAARGRRRRKRPEQDSNLRPTH